MAAAAALVRRVACSSRARRDDARFIQRAMTNSGWRPLRALRAVQAGAVYTRAVRLRDTDTIAAAGAWRPAAWRTPAAQPITRIARAVAPRRGARRPRFCRRSGRRASGTGRGGDAPGEPGDESDLDDHRAGGA
jgi:hypothetical protein